MSDDEFIDPSWEVKTLDEMPQFEDEQTPQPSTPPPNATVEDKAGFISRRLLNQKTLQNKLLKDCLATESPPQDIAPAAPISRDLESMVLGISQDDSNSLAGTELETEVAKNYLHTHKLGKALSSVTKAENSLVDFRGGCFLSPQKHRYAPQASEL